MILCPYLCLVVLRTFMTRRENVIELILGILAFIASYFVWILATVGVPFMILLIIYIPISIIEGVCNVFKAEGR